MWCSPKESRGMRIGDGITGDVAVFFTTASASSFNTYTHIRARNNIDAMDPLTHRA